MGQINDYTAETAILDTDQFVLQKTAGGLTKKSLWSLMKSTLKTYFDTLYMSISSGASYASKTVTASTYSVTDSDMTNYDQIEFDTTSNAIVITLPDRATNNGYKIRIKHSIQDASLDIVTINCAGADTITQDLMASIVLPRSGNYIEFFASSVTGNWEILDEAITCGLKVSICAGAGSTDTAIPRYGTLNYFYGNFFTENHVSGYNGNTEGLKLTIVRSGKYRFEESASFNAANSCGSSLDSSQLTTDIKDITPADILSIAATRSASDAQNHGATRYFTKGQVIRPHADPGFPGTGDDDRTFSEIEYLGQ